MNYIQYVCTYVRSIAILFQQLYFSVFAADFYSKGVQNNVILNATKFHSVLPLDTPPGSYILTLGFVLLRTEITLYHHSFYQTDGFQHPITIDPYSGTATTQDYLVEGQYTLNFVLLVQPFDVISGSLTVDVINNLGTYVRMFLWTVCTYVLYVRYMSQVT